VLSVVPEEFPSRDDQAADSGTSASASLIDQIVRDGARRMLAEALQAEVEAYIARFTASATTTAAGWSCATDPTSLGRC
jgi:hypothetical protein